MLQSAGISQAARNPLAWGITFLLALLAWIPTIQQSLSMPPMPGTMGMNLAAFLLFWMPMMAAMMLPAFAPMISIQFEMVQGRTRGLLLVMRIGVFILGYLLLWTAFGLPVFWLALSGEYLMHVAPQIAIDLGVILFIGAGIYQMTPLAVRCLAHCNLHLFQPHECTPSAQNLLQDLGAGIRHGLYCLGCCGALMLILVAVGLMNLFWMLIITLIIFLEKIWQRDASVSFVIGALLIMFGFLAFLSPWLLPGVNL